jgi:hypothetical protein
MHKHLRELQGTGALKSSSKAAASVSPCSAEIRDSWLQEIGLSNLQEERDLGGRGEANRAQTWKWKRTANCCFVETDVG